MIGLATGTTLYMLKLAVGLTVNKDSISRRDAGQSFYSTQTSDADLGLLIFLTPTPDSDSVA